MRIILICLFVTEACFLLFTYQVSWPSLVGVGQGFVIVVVYQWSSLGWSLKNYLIFGKHMDRWQIWTSMAVYYIYLWVHAKYGGKAQFLSGGHLVETSSTEKGNLRCNGGFSVASRYYNWTDQLKRFSCFGVFVLDIYCLFVLILKHRFLWYVINSCLDLFRWMGIS